MKKIMFPIALLMLSVSAHAQLLFSHFDEWGDETYQDCADISRRVCHTFNTLYVNGGPQVWKRIGTPQPPSPPGPFDPLLPTSLIGMIGNGLTEGVFTEFDFIPGKTYIIKVGINSSSNATGKLQFFASNGLLESDPGNWCCQETHLEGSTLPGGVGPADSYYETNAGGGTLPGLGNPPSIHYIATITPGTISAGALTEKYLKYTPLSYYSQFVITAKKGSSDYLTFLDYLSIEEICDAQFGMILRTNNIKLVDFSANFYPYMGIGYNWTLGDGNIQFQNDFTHLYSSTGSYSPCMQLSWDDDDTWGCQECASLCLNNPTSEDPQGPPPNSEDPNPEPTTCGNSDFDFFLPSTGREVGLTPHSGTESYWRVDWGDGATSYDILPMSFIHTYPTGTPGSTSNYNVCLEVGTNGTKCRTCLDICIKHDLYIEYGPDDRDIYDGEEGRYYQASNKRIADPAFRLESIAPNPAHTETTLNIYSNTERNATAVVTDITGKTVLKVTKVISIGNNAIVLPVANLNRGMYMVEVTADDKSIKEKFIKE